MNKNKGDCRKMPYNKLSKNACLKKNPFCISTYIYIYRMSQEECANLRESVPYVKEYRHNPKHLYPKLNGYGYNGHRSLEL
jgi:hypothetical protein